MSCLTAQLAGQRHGEAEQADPKQERQGAVASARRSYSIPFRRWARMDGPSKATIDNRLG